MDRLEQYMQAELSMLKLTCVCTRLRVNIQNEPSKSAILVSDMLLSKNHMLIFQTLLNISVRDIGPLESRNWL